MPNGIRLMRLFAVLMALCVAGTVVFLSLRALMPIWFPNDNPGSDLPANQKKIWPQPNSFPFPKQALPFGAISRLPTAHPISAMSYSPNGKLLAMGLVPRVLWVWEAATGKLVHICEGQRGEVSALSFSPDSRELASNGGFGDSVRIWNMATGKVFHVFKKTNWGCAYLAYSPKGRTFATAMEEQVQIWDASTYKLLHVLDQFGSNLVLSSDGRTLAANALINQVPVITLWDVETGKKSAECEGHDWKMGISQLAFSPDSESLFSAAQNCVFGMQKTARSCVCWIPWRRSLPSELFPPIANRWLQWPKIAR